MAENANKPFVTVVMPVRNEAEHIEQCVRSVLESDYPADRFQVLVVDGMSDDSTPTFAPGPRRLPGGSSPRKPIA